MGKVPFGAVAHCKYGDQSIFDKTGKIMTTRVLVTYKTGVTGDYFIAYRTKIDMFRPINDLGFINNTALDIKMHRYSKKRRLNEIKEKLLKPLWDKVTKAMPGKEIRHVSVENILVPKTKERIDFEF